jgi:hypothetical protein
VLPVAFIVLLSAAPPPTAAASPIRVEERALETPAGPLHAWLATVDLTDSRVGVMVTAPLERTETTPERAEALLLPTDAWAARVGADLAVNANFFARVDLATLGAAWTEGLPVDIVGLSRSDGRTVSPPRAAAGDPALLLDETAGHCPCSARVAVAAEKDLDGMEEAVAGRGGHDGQPGTLLVEDGQNRGATAQVQPLARHPRTAAGVSRDGRTLMLLVVDGRQPGWSIGATLPELATMMIEAGAWNAVNLDGGGSSAMWHREPGAAAGRVLNRPSDGRVRPTANHLGVCVSARAGEACGRAREARSAVP